VNQHQVGSTGGFQSTFMELIKSVCRVVMVITPHYDPIPFTRVWCLFEVFSAIKTNTTFQLAMSEPEKNILVETMQTDFYLMFNLLSRVDVARGEAGIADDKICILRLIEQEVGLSEMNQLVKQKLRDSIGLVLKEAVDASSNELDKAHRMMALAKYFYQMSEYDKALQLYQEAFAIRLQLLEGTHPDIVASCDDIAALFHTLDQDASALEWYQKALVIRLGNKAAGLHSLVPATDDINFNKNMANVSFLQEEYTQALEYFEKALLICRDTHGENHHDVGYLYGHIAFMYEHLEQQEEALLYFEKTMWNLQKALGEKHPDVGVVCFNLAQFYCDEALWTQALELYEKGVEIHLEAVGEKHLAEQYYVMAGLYSNQGKYQYAIEFYKKSLQICQVSPAYGDSVAVLYHDMASAYQMLDESRLALEHFEKALEADAAALGESQLDVPDIFFNMALANSEMGAHCQALVCYEKALTIYLSAMSEHKTRVIQIYLNMAAECRQLAQYDKSRKFIIDACGLEWN
jgi:tetratricopeptide (TPR) repeat protein